MSWPAYSMDTIDAPWVSSTIRSGITPGHASVGAMLALITQSRPHDSSTARTIEASANIENGPDESDEYRSRKRGRYSCLKCSTCRKDKKKCTPEDRQPGQTCNRCLSMRAPCSDAKTARQQRERREVILQSPPTRSMVLVEDPWFQDCVLLLNWFRMLTDIKSVADEIDSDIRTGARAPHVSNQSPSILKGIGDDIRLVTGLFGKQIGILSGQNNTPECMERAMALKARIRALPYCDFGYFGFLLSRVLDEGSTIHDGLDSLTDVERWVNLIYMPQYPGTEEFDQAMRSRLEQYISSFKSLWRRISEMVDGYVLGGIFVRSPFVNEFWVPHQSVHGDFLDHLQRADTESILRQDSLGRTSLHFLIEYGVDSKVADYLLNHRNLLDVTDAFGRTALHVACSRKRQGGSYSTVRLLLQKKATIGIRDAYGLLAIDYAVIDNREDILRVFQEVRGVDIQGTLVAMKQAEEERKRVAVAVDAACEHLDKEIVKKARNGQDLVMLS